MMLTFCASVSFLPKRGGAGRFGSLFTSTSAPLHLGKVKILLKWKAMGSTPSLFHCVWMPWTDKLRTFGTKYAKPMVSFCAYWQYSSVDSSINPDNQLLKSWIFTDLSGIQLNTEKKSLMFYHTIQIYVFHFLKNHHQHYASNFSKQKR